MYKIIKRYFKQIKKCYDLLLQKLNLSTNNSTTNNNEKSLELQVVSNPYVKELQIVKKKTNNPINDNEI